MKPFLKIFILVALIPLSGMKAQIVYAVSGNQTMTIQGTSNVHDWDEEVTKIYGEGAFLLNPDASVTISALIIKIDIKDIKSSHGSIMDNKTYDALKSDKFPVITYKLLAPLTIKQSAAGVSVASKGQISIAGVTKPLDMQVKVTAKENGILLFEGSKTLKMTDFGVSPPTAFMGAMKVGEDIVISFKTSMQKKNSPATPLNN